MTTAKKSKKAAPGAGYDRHDATACAERAARMQLRREALIAERDAAVLKAAEPYQGEIDRLEQGLMDDLERLAGWAAAHPEEFEDRESTILGNGIRVGWRLGNWSVKTAPKWTWEKVRAAIEEFAPAWRERLLRVKTEVDKEALLKLREERDFSEVGVRFEQARRFYLEPAREGQEGARVNGDR